MIEFEKKSEREGMLHHDSVMLFMVCYWFTAKWPLFS